MQLGWAGVGGGEVQLRWRAVERGGVRGGCWEVRWTRGGGRIQLI